MSMPHVGFFVTCLVDLMRPQIGFASLRLLEDAGCRVSIPSQQTCCGQPAFNSGDDETAREVARQVVETFADFDYLVTPSGSCAGMIRHHIPKLLEADKTWADEAKTLAQRTFEITSFLTDIRNFQPTPPPMAAKATYHDSCSGLRELGVVEQPRKLLAAVEGLELVPLVGRDICCGFGGTFCVKFPEISDAIVTSKAEAIEATGADLLLAGDLGCLMNMAGKLSRRGSNVRCFHTVEVLAGMTETAIIDR